jgi:hypothetical protein
LLDHFELPDHAAPCEFLSSLLEVRDQLRIYPGCHKRVLEDCRDRFRIPGSLLFDKGNVRNFRGEPYVPGNPLTAAQAGRG